MTMLSERQQMSYIAAQAADARLNVELETEGMTLNIGPQHPATHGTLRIIARLDGEQVVWAEPSAGYMHRGYEKLTEVRRHPCEVRTSLPDPGKRRRRWVLEGSRWFARTSSCPGHPGCRPLAAARHPL